MADIEIHSAHPVHDAAGKSVGLLVGVIGVCLAAVTIAAHREHTAAVIHRTEANDSWGYYQAKKTREHVSSVAWTLLGATGGDPNKTIAAMQQFSQERSKYAADAEHIKQEAEARDQQTRTNEAHALRLDLGEGLLELGLVLSSLYFLGRQRLFPIVGGGAAILGLLTALSTLAGGLWGG